MENTRRHREQTFPNGDVYCGDNLGMVPHGNGKYMWSDGTVYEGVWEDGKMMGWGKIVWSSGSIYEGEFSGGYLHGHGCFTASDGSTYDGAWRMNTKHGFGRKKYSNNDSYEGSWKEGLRQGNGTYIWNSGNTYIGTWKAGLMSGTGLLKWENGDIFYGFWLDGLRNGSGFYRFADGGCYCGTWSRGIKDGRGMFYPAGSKHVSLKKWLKSAGYHERLGGELSRISSRSLEANMTLGPRMKRSVSENVSSGNLNRSSSHISSRSSLDGDGTLGDIAREFSSKDGSCKLICKSNDFRQDGDEERDVFFEREYMQGVLIRERVRKHAGRSFKVKPHTKFTIKDSKSRSCFSRSEQSHYFMLNLQLGIRYTLNRLLSILNSSKS